MQLGKLTFPTDFAPRDIDSDVPAFHRELLCAWINYKCYHERIDIPDSLLDIFEEPLFINVNKKPLFYRDWVSYGLVRVKDICYEAAPGFLPGRALHEILIDHESCKDRTFNQTARELSKVLEGIPAKRKLKVINGDSVSSSPAQPRFSFLPSAPDKPPTSTLDCKTRHFYRQFHKSEQISSPTKSCIAFDTQSCTCCIKSLFISKSNRRKEFSELGGVVVSDSLIMYFSRPGKLCEPNRKIYVNKPEEL